MTPPAGGCKVSPCSLFCWGSKVSLLLHNVFALVHLVGGARDHWLRLLCRLASSSSSFCQHINCTHAAWVVDSPGSPSRSPHTNTRAPPSAAVGLLFLQVTCHRFLLLHCCITSTICTPHPFRGPLPLCVLASRPSMSMHAPGSSSPTPTLVEVHPQSLGTCYLLLQLGFSFRSSYLLPLPQALLAAPYHQLAGVPCPMHLALPLF